MKSTDIMATDRTSKKRKPAKWKKTALHLLAWALLIAVLFYGLHRYFEFREHELDKRLEQLSK